MTLPRTVADVLSDHVVFEVESIDRMYLNVYQPRLQYGGGVQGFFVGHRGHKSACRAKPCGDQSGILERRYGVRGFLLGRSWVLAAGEWALDR
jgi:hypothetical protein